VELFLLEIIAINLACSHLDLDESGRKTREFSGAKEIVVLRGRKIIH
jgi:hypothetical protein